jgi:hypothetical protein
MSVFDAVLALGEGLKEGGGEAILTLTDGSRYVVTEPEQPAGAEKVLRISTDGIRFVGTPCDVAGAPLPGCQERTVYADRTALLSLQVCRPEALSEGIDRMIYNAMDATAREMHEAIREAGER